MCSFCVRLRRALLSNSHSPNMGQVSPITHARHQARQTSVSRKENAKRNCLYKARYAVCITNKDDPFESEFLNVLLLVYISSSQSDPNMTYPICNKTENKSMQKALRTLLLFFWKKISCFYILKNVLCSWAVTFLEVPQTAWLTAMEDDVALDCQLLKQ